MDLSIIIVSYNVKDLARECLSRVRRSKDKLEKETIFVDNNFSDGTTDMIKKDFREIVLIENKRNLGYGRANNLAYTKTKGEYVLVLNPDAFIAEDTIQKTVDFMEQNSECGILGCRLVGADGKVQQSGRYFPTPWRLFMMYSGLDKKFPHHPLLKGLDNMSWKQTSIREADWVSGSCFLVRREMVDKIGFFSKDYYLYYEEIDLCMRAKKNGWKVFFYPETSVIHLGGKSAKEVGEITPIGKQLENLKLQSEFIYFRKNHGMCYVCMDLFFIFLFDMIEILKKIILRKKHILISQKIAHMKITCKSLIATRFGAKSVN